MNDPSSGSPSRASSPTQIPIFPRRVRHNPQRPRGSMTSIIASDQDEREDGNDHGCMKEVADALVPPVPPLPPDGASAVLAARHPSVPNEPRASIWQEREREHRG